MRGNKWFTEVCCLAGIVLVFIGVSHAIKCYDCDSERDEICKEDGYQLINSNSTDHTDSCGGVCAKSVHTYTDDSEPFRIDRYCTQTVCAEELRVRDTIEIQTHCCTTDFCNTAFSLKFSIKLMILVLLCSFPVLQLL